MGLFRPPPPPYQSPDPHHETVVLSQSVTNFVCHGSSPSTHDTRWCSFFCNKCAFFDPKPPTNTVFILPNIFVSPQNTVRSLSNRPNKVPATGQLKVECSFNRRLYSLGSNRHLCIVLILIWIHHNARRRWRLEIKLPVAV